MDRAALRALHRQNAPGQLRKVLRDYFSSPEGQAALRAAPRVFGTEDAHPMTIDEAVDALMDEAATMKQEN